MAVQRRSARGVGYTVRSAGAGAPAVLLANSLGATQRSWSALLERLPAGVTVLTYDLRGHGRSPSREAFAFDDLVRDAVSVVDSEGIAAAHWCGVSLGGMVGVAFAARHPERTASLTALSAPAYQENPDFWTARAADVRARGMTAASSGVANRWFSEPFRVANPAAVQETVADLEALDPAGYAACCEAMAHADVRGEAPAIRAPAVFGAGAEDAAVSPRHSDVLAGLVTGARRLSFAGRSHMLGIEAADEIAELLGEMVTGGE